MILSSSIKVKTEWKPNPCLTIDDDTCDLYAINLYVFHNNEWYNISGMPNLKNKHFFTNHFEFRMKWRFKVWGYVNEELKLLHDEIYNEENKQVSIYFDNYIYSSHEKWMIQSLSLAQKYKFKPIIVSRFSKKLKNKFSNNENLIFSEQEYKEKQIENLSYAKYMIKRNVMDFNTLNDWETGGIFSNCSLFFKSWQHKRNWTSMTDEELFNDIMNYE
tara:strand:- start:2119 stop:2769 length:651 start_codon:yes stop_codon:yes gene_type:complete